MKFIAESAERFFNPVIRSKDGLSFLMTFVKKASIEANRTLVNIKSRSLVLDD